MELGGGHAISLISRVNSIFLTDQPPTTSLKVGFVQYFSVRLVFRLSARVRIPTPQITGGKYGLAGSLFSALVEHRTVG